MQTPETAWTAGLRRGDPAAFDAVYDAYRPRIYGFLYRWTGRSTVAEELCQETFLRLATHGPRLREDTDLAAWLFTVARNQARSWQRWSWLDAARIAQWAQGKANVGGDSPLAQAVASEQARALELALAALPLAHREAFLLVCVDQLEPQQAAEVLGIRPDAFRQRLARARAALHTALNLEERP